MEMKGSGMKIDEMIQLAREAGWEYADNDVGTGYSPLWKFGELVAAAEREACAKLCEEAHWSLDDRAEYASAIRARGNNGL